MWCKCDTLRWSLMFWLSEVFAWIIYITRSLKKKKGWGSLESDVMQYSYQRIMFRKLAFRIGRDAILTRDWLVDLFIQALMFLVGMGFCLWTKSPPLWLLGPLLSDGSSLWCTWWFGYGLILLVCFLLVSYISDS